MEFKVILEHPLGCQFLAEKGILLYFLQILFTFVTFDMFDDLPLGRLVSRWGNSTLDCSKVGEILEALQGEGHRQGHLSIQFLCPTN